jgi:hypothetical protein
VRETDTQKVEGEKRKRMRREEGRG